MQKGILVISGSKFLALGENKITIMDLSFHNNLVYHKSNRQPDITI